MSASKRNAPAQDPWIDFEIETDKACGELRIFYQRFADNPKPTLVARQDFFDTAEKYLGLIEEATVAQQMTLEHPELFAVTTEEIQRRDNKVKEWERLAKKPVQEYKLAMERQMRGESISSNGLGGAGGGGATAQDQRNVDNGDFLQREYEEQRRITSTQDQAIDRITVHVAAMKNNAELINEELKVQESMLDELSQHMTNVQRKLEGALGKVGKLLDESSDKNKIICIIVLVIVLAILITVLFNGN